MQYSKETDHIHYLVVASCIPCPATVSFLFEQSYPLTRNLAKNICEIKNPKQLHIHYITLLVLKRS